MTNLMLQCIGAAVTSAGVAVEGDAFMKDKAPLVRDVYVHKVPIFVSTGALNVALMPFVGFLPATIANLTISLILYWKRNRERKGQDSTVNQGVIYNAIHAVASWFSKLFRPQEAVNLL